MNNESIKEPDWHGATQCRRQRQHVQIKNTKNIGHLKKKGGEIDVHQHGRHAGDDLTQGNQYFSLPKHSVQSFHSGGPVKTGTTVSFFSAATTGCRRPKKKYDDTQVQQTAQQQHGDYGVPKLGAIGAFRARVSFFDVICSAGEAKKTSVPEVQKKKRISTKRSHLPHSSVSVALTPVHTAD